MHTFLAASVGTNLGNGISENLIIGSVKWATCSPTNIHVSELWFHTAQFTNTPVWPPLGLG